MNPATLEPMTLVYHELRSPLGLLATAARSAAEECDDENLKSRCEIIVRAAERMLRTAQQLLDLARGDDGREPEAFSPTDIILVIAADNTALGSTVETVITPAARRAWTLAVREVFEALMQSLVSNALDHGDPDVAPVVQVAAEEDALVVEVRNRVGTAKQHEGLGLGSYIARGLAEQLGARIETIEARREHVVRLHLPVVS
ncbi:MAG: HAMP domain-containing histidine kinase [Dehalococcoidia bacterium]|nr:HAMP domain-containing histidine kinase [Dehalococcoidia bacterium]